MTDLAHFIADAPLVNTHEHQSTNEWLLEQTPDVLDLIVDNYFSADLHTADPTLPHHQWGIDLGLVAQETGPSLEARYARLAPAIKHARLTSYGEAQRLMLQALFGVADLSLASLQSAQEKLTATWQPGMRRQLLAEAAKLDHIQIDAFTPVIPPDSEDREFFLYDIQLGFLCNGYVQGLRELDPRWQPHFDAIVPDEIKTLEDLRGALAAIYAHMGPIAIATKLQHAYSRTLRWEPRTDAEAAQALEVNLKQSHDAPVEAKLTLGDWVWSRVMEHSIAHGLPVKIHTGYYAGNFHMRPDFIRPGHLSPLLKAYPDAKFVLMHIGYPYEDEMVAMAKHFPNVWVDLCWAWSIDRRSSTEFVRKFLSAVPYNKLFAFGGDTIKPHNVVGYALQARRGLTDALQTLVDERFCSEADALQIAAAVMRENQYAVFDITGTRANLRARG